MTADLAQQVKSTTADLALVAEQRAHREPAVEAQARRSIGGGAECQRADIAETSDTEHRRRAAAGITIPDDGDGPVDRLTRGRG